MRRKMKLLLKLLRNHIGVLEWRGRGRPTSLSWCSRWCRGRGGWRRGRGGSNTSIRCRRWCRCWCGSTRLRGERVRCEWGTASSVTWRGTTLCPDQWRRPTSRRNTAGVPTTRCWWACWLRTPHAPHSSNWLAADGTSYGIYPLDWLIDPTAENRYESLYPWKTSATKLQTHPVFGGSSIEDVRLVFPKWICCTEPTWTHLSPNGQKKHAIPQTDRT